MAFSPLSFLLGIGTAYLVPIISRNFRPVAVEATAMGLGLLEDLRRVLAEQMENLEDIAAEARARRDQLTNAVSSETDDEAEGPDGEAEVSAETIHETSRPRRRTSKARPAAE